MKTLPIKFVIFLLLFSFAFAMGEQSIFAQDKRPTKAERSRSVAQDRGADDQKPAPYMEAISNYREKKIDKIVGGKKVNRIEDYPWQVSLGVSSSEIPDPFYAHFCGGSVYSDTWIITAAHCVRGLTPQEFNITAGTIDLVKGGTKAEVKRVIVHKDYSKNTKNNDIALIELLNPLPLSDKITTIALLTPNDETNILTDNAKFDVTGWGWTQDGGQKSRDLRYLDNLPILKSTTCNRPLFYNGRITDNMICAGDPSGGKDACKGDSGGPLAIAAGNGNRWLAGVVSWGEGCARQNKVGVYTRIPKYAQWVSECVSNSENCNR